jgi:hypothetical protein
VDQRERWIHRENDPQHRLGSARADVEQRVTGYGLPPSTAPVSDPPATLSRDFGHGFFVEYGSDDRVRAVTICRSYNAEPSARIVVANSALDFNASGVSFIKLKAPYYGGMEGADAGIGSARAALEQAMQLGTGGFSDAGPGLLSRPGKRETRRDYTADATPLVTGISVPLMQCP